METRDIITKKKSESNEVKTRDIIIDSAKKLFITQGYIKTTTRQIAKDADVNLGLISYYFKNKKNIAMIVYQDIITQIYKQVNVVIENYTYKNAVEKLFLTFVIAQKLTNQDNQVLKFHLDMIDEGIIPTYTYDMSVSFYLINELAQEENINLSLEQKTYYGLMLQGAENMLMKKKRANEIDINYIEINKLIVINICSLLGVNMNKVNQAIENCCSQFDETFIQSLQ